LAQFVLTLHPDKTCLIHRPSLQPLADQAYHAAVDDPMLDKTDQPLVASSRAGEELAA